MGLEHRPLFTVRATYAGDGAWVLHFDEWVGVAVTVADIRQAEHAAREQLAATIGRPVDSFEVQVDLELRRLVEA